MDLDYSWAEYFFFLQIKLYTDWNQIRHCLIYSRLERWFILFIEEILKDKFFLPMETWSDYLKLSKSNDIADPRNIKYK